MLTAHRERPAVRVLVVSRTRSRATSSRGRPLRPRTGGTASTSGISWVTSWRLPPVTVQASGIPVASTRRWCFDPFLALSTGLGPVSEPLFRLHVTGVGDRPRPLELTGGTQLSKQERVQPLPHPCSLPLVQARGSRSRHSRSPAPAADAAKRSRYAARTRSPATPRDRAAASGPDSENAAASSRQERPHTLPQLVRNDPRRNSHRHPSQLDDRCRRRSSSGERVLHFDSSS